MFLSFDTATVVESAAPRIAAAPTDPKFSLNVHTVKKNKDGKKAAFHSFSLAYRSIWSRLWENDLSQLQHISYVLRAQGDKVSQALDSRMGLISGFNFAQENFAPLTPLESYRMGEGRYHRFMRVNVRPVAGDLFIISIGSVDTKMFYSLCYKVTHVDYTQYKNQFRVPYFNAELVMAGSDNGTNLRILTVDDTYAELKDLFTSYIAQTICEYDKEYGLGQYITTMKKMPDDVVTNMSEIAIGEEYRVNNNGFIDVLSNIMTRRILGAGGNYDGQYGDLRRENGQVVLTIYPTHKTLTKDILVFDEEPAGLTLLREPVLGNIGNSVVAVSIDF